MSRSLREKGPQGRVSEKKSIGSALQPSVENRTSSFDFESHTRDVAHQLGRFGFGETATFLTGDTIGINRQQYLSYTRQRLLGPEFADGVAGKELPAKIGEVDTPPLLRQRGQNISAILLSLNVGYGHLRPALAMQNLVELLGGKARNAFLAGEEDVIPRTGPGDFGGWKDINRFLRAVARQYRTTNLNTAYKLGMMHEEPQHIDPDPKYTQLVHSVFSRFGGDRKAFQEDPEGAIAKIMTFTEERSPMKRWASNVGISILFRKSIREFIEQSFWGNFGRDKLVIATQPTIAEGIGTITYPRRKLIGFVAANFQPDIGMFYDSYTANPPTYTEKAETVEKWGIKQGLSNGEHAKNTVVLNGYITPLSVFDRTHLSEERKKALQDGHPLTVVATASGNAPAQLGAFKEFITTNLQQFADKSLRMVIECGAEEGGGLIVHNELKSLVEKHQLEDSVVLHASKTPEASLQFFEAISWTPMPIAMLVKASEMTRIAQALNVPLISTGALGPHELWNVAATLLDNPTSVVFSPKVAATVQDGISQHFPHDALVQQYPERQYIERIQENLSRQTAQGDSLSQMVRDYIMSGHESSSDAGAMLILLTDMLQRRDRERILPTRRGKN